AVPQGNRWCGNPFSHRHSRGRLCHSTIEDIAGRPTMADEDKKIIVDDDWKAQARAEKERLAGEAEQQPQPGEMPEPSFVELINLVVMQAMAGLGLLAGP